MKLKKQKLLVIEANIDDMNPEWFEPLMEKLFEVGALDVVLIPIIMKRSRPAVTLQVLAKPTLQKKLLEIIFRESTTLGVRNYTVDRFELNRKTKEVKTPYGMVVVKMGLDEKGAVVNCQPEYRSCREVAKRGKVPIKTVYRAAIKQF